jgi:intein/homing endonuclease
MSGKMVTLTEEQLSKKIDFIERYKLSNNAADGSDVDANANVSHKNIATLEAEINKDINIQINQKLIYNKICEIYDKELADEFIHQINDHEIYLHDASALRPYCVSISMYPFLLDGMIPLGGDSKAPQHMESFCGSFINLVFAISAQFAGAIATVEFLMMFDYFARKDYGKNYLRTHKDKVANHLQHVVYALNQPAAARGYQCVREDTTQLMTPDGFKYLSELKEGDKCYVWDKEDEKIKVQTINRLNVYDYDDEMLQFKGRNYQQTVTPNHRVVYKKPNTNEYDIKEAYELFGHSKLSLPISSELEAREDYPISDELLQLCVATLTDGHIYDVKEGNNFSGRIKIYKSKNRWGYKEIPTMLDKLGIGYKTSDVTSNEFGEMVSFDISRFDAQIILRQLKHTKQEIPYFFNQLSARQAKLVIDTWSRFDGTSVDSSHTMLLQCDNDSIRDSLQEIAFLAGYGSEIYNRPMTKFNSDEECIVKYVKIFKRKDKRVSEYNRVQYKGKVWCPTTDAGVVIFREENGIPYISGNSVFWNISVFDREYFNSIFENFYFPDGTVPDVDSLVKLQDFFMDWFNRERTKAVLSFPVVTATMLVDKVTNKPKDIAFARMCAKEMSRGNSFFIYMSDSADSLASCCFDGSQKVLTRSSKGVNYMSFEDFHNAKYDDIKRNLKIFHNGSWVQGKSIKLDGSNKKLYKVITANNKEIIVTDDHLNPTLIGDKYSSKLTTDDYLAFNNLALDSFSEKDEHLTYEQGVLIGAFLGDGSFGGRVTLSDGTIKIYETSFSLNKDCFEELKKNIDIAAKQCGSNNELKLGSIYNNVYPTRISSQEVVNFIKRWVDGNKHDTKSLNLDCLLQSKGFRQGILDGLYLTDGGNSNRIYTVSDQLKEGIEILLTSLGYNSIINTSDRTNEKFIIRGEEFNRNFPLHCIRWYSSKNRRSMKDVYIVKNNSIYFKIKSIEELPSVENVYCFEMKNQDEPYFTLPNGVITHNCRLRNEFSDNTFSYTLGAGGVSTGSINVITLNMNRFIQNCYREFEVKSATDDIKLFIEQALHIQVKKMQAYQVAYRKVIEEYLEARLLTVYDAGFISIDKQFLTLGINGMVEAAEFCGIPAKNTPEYKEFVSSKLKVIFDANKAMSKETGYKFNTEFVPKMCGDLAV